MKAQIQRRALELGFAACRVTTAAPAVSAGRFRDWLAAGRHGEMAWMARDPERRTDPGRVLPGARSLIVLAFNYHREGRNAGTAGTGMAGGVRSDTHETRAGRYGEVARYARGPDYHEVLAEPLARLCRFVEEIGGPGVRSRACVDTAPVLERDLAQRAGLGFIGKHTNLISRELGNWFFVAEILTTLELEPDVAEENRCGRCVRCLDACPTRAIVAPFQLDARRCIAYLTIELKGSIPVELRPAVGRRIFGCDDCLAVCPWNRFARESAWMKGACRSDLDRPDLLELLALDEAGFRRRFRETPLWRSRRRGLLRNVCVALGNAAGAEALPALRRAASDPEPLIAEHAAWAIGRIAGRLNEVHAVGTGPGQAERDSQDTKRTGG